MKKLILGIAIMLLCSGCGHNVISYSEGWGISLTWNPSNSISPKIDAGDIESFNAVIKENTEVVFEKDSGGMIIDTTNVKKPSTFKLSIKTGNQINGYAVEVERIKSEK